MSVSEGSAFRVSVVIPAYNSGEYLPAAIESALDQTLAPVEVIVVDDGSTDETPALAAQFGDRIVYVRQANQGVSSSRNLGLERARGNWVAFLDADDLWVPTKLERFAEYAHGDPGLVCLFSDFEVFGHTTRTCRPSLDLSRWESERDEVLLVPSLSVMPSAAMVRADLPTRFPTWARNDEDAIYFNEVSEYGRLAAVPEVLMRYRRHNRSAQAQSGAERRGFANLLRWADSRGGDARARLFRTFVHLMVSARWQRRWDRYWTYRGLLNEHWQAGDPLPPALSERVWPRMVYRIKDAWDALVQRGEECHAN